ncbi:MAG: hypothetical protein WAN43_00565 [Rhodomicrobium sp.]
MAALASYGRQANDETLVRLAMRIQGRAIRKAGVLLQQISSQSGGDRRSFDYQQEGDRQLVSRTNAAREAGFSEHQQKQALRLANIPEDEFESAIEDEEPPTITDLAERGTRRRAIVNDENDDVAHTARAEFALKTFEAQMNGISPAAVGRYARQDKEVGRRIAASALGLHLKLEQLLWQLEEAACIAPKT